MIPSRSLFIKHNTKLRKPRILLYLLNSLTWLWVTLGILGTIIIVGGGFGLYWYLK